MYCVFGLCIVAISNVDPVPAAHRPVPAPRRPVPASRGTFKNPFYGKSNDFAQLLDKKLEQEEQEKSGFAISKIVFIQCSKSNQYLLPTVTQIFRETKVGNIKGLKTTILTHLEALNFDFDDFLQFLQTEICQKQNSEPLNCKNGSF